MARYEVFLSFRGVDTRKKFTDHLYYGLSDAGINTFRDDPELHVGEDISPALIQAIRSSRISVIVFSKNYAGLRWCLQELAEIMECRESSGQMVLPIFCGVDPPDVRYQRGSYAEAFVKHGKRLISEEETVVLARWRRALTQAANLSGWDVADGHEGKIVKEIVRKISNELKHVHLNVAKYPVGLNIRLEDVNKLINSGTDGVRFVGICGIGGIGKTTLAKAVYNQFFHTFEGKSFLANVRENSEQSNGLLQLQKQLLCDILKLENIKLGSIHRGINVIKERLRSKRVLVVLDDLNNLDQLRTLAGGHKWFGSGSKIIITTRNLDLLKEVGADLCMVRGLNDEESLQLFSFHAFRNNHPEDEFVELSKAITSYSDGLPLALEVLGSFLYGRTVVEWSATLEKLKRIPKGGIQAQLRISYDALLDDTEKALFLDIACFFVGWHRDYVVKTLDACGLFAEIGTVVLTERCLLEVDYQGRLRMHDLLRYMGREIVRVESPNYPGKRSRLWFYEDVLSTLRNHQGTKEVEGITLELPASNELILTAEAFSRMSRLRLLQLKHVDVRGDYTHVSKELRWLCWHNFPLKFIPDKLCLENIIAIDFQYSKLQATWKAMKILGSLKVLNLSHSHFLTKTPDFSKLPSLEELILEDCKELKEVDKSLGCLDRLVFMNLKDCKKLQSIPTSICRVKSLQILEISGCSCINQLPDDFGELESLTKFIADAVPIMKLPLSIGKLRNLTHLSLSLFGSKTTRSSSISSLIWSLTSARGGLSRNNLLITSVSELSFLKSLRLEDCHLSDGAILESMGKLQFLESLNLKGNHFQHLPNSISCLANLKSVVVQDCPKLESLPDMPPSLTVLRAANCISLERISLSNCLHVDIIDIMNCSKLESLPNMPLSLTALMAANCTSLERISFSNCLRVNIIDLINCSKLIEISHLGNWNSDGYLYFVGCTNLPSKYKETLLKEWRGKQLSIPGDEIPEWFEYQSRSPPLYFQIPSCHSYEMKGIAVCVVCKFNPNIRTTNPLFILTNKTRNLQRNGPFPFWLVSQLLNNNHMFIFFVPACLIMGDLDHSANKVSLDVETDGHWTVSGIGIHFECKVSPSCSTTRLSSCGNIGFKGSSLVGNGDTKVGSSHDGSSSEDYRQPKRMCYELAPETNIDEEWLLEVKLLRLGGR